MPTMARTDVYNWRLDVELKEQLEEAARVQKTTVDKVLARLAREWLKQRKSAIQDEEQEQARLRNLAMSFAGIIEGDGRSATNARVREVMGERLEAKRGKQSSD